MRRRRAGDHPGVSRAVRASGRACATNAASRGTAAMRLYIKETAKRHGLEVKAFRKEADGLFHRRPPFIVFWELNHFLVVEGFRRRRVHLNDPAIGRRTVSLDEFRRSYSGIAFTFELGPGFVKQGGRPSALAGLAARLSRSRRGAGVRGPGRSGPGDPEPGRGGAPARLHRRAADRGTRRVAPAAALRRRRDGPDAAGRLRPSAGRTSRGWSSG